MSKYSAIFDLKEKLEQNNIPFDFIQESPGTRFEHNQISYPNFGNGRIISVIQGFGTYGNESDLLEIMGLLTPEEQERDNVAGFLTVENVFERIKAHWGGAGDE